jgi:hypothetical protein
VLADVEPGTNGEGLEIGIQCALEIRGIDVPHVGFAVDVHEEPR